MSQERHHDHAERHERQNEELEKSAREKLEELSHNPEANVEDAENRAAKARETIQHQEQEPEPKPAAEAEHHAPAQHILAKLGYADTLASVQRRLTPISRSFSKIIHTPVVEKTSEALEKTVARPSVAVGATWTALIVGSVFYLVARHYGYALSGSEMLFSFVVGAVLGLVIEGIWRSLRRS